MPSYTSLLERFNSRMRFECKNFWSVDLSAKFKEAVSLAVKLLFER